MTQCSGMVDIKETVDTRPCRAKAAFVVDRQPYCFSHVPDRSERLEKVRKEKEDVAANIIQELSSTFEIVAKEAGKTPGNYKEFQAAQSFLRRN